MSAAEPDDVTTPGSGDEVGGPPAPPRSARRQFASTILVLEAFVVLFAVLVAYGLRVAPPEVLVAVGASLGLALVVVAGLLRWPGAYVAGSVLQLGLLGLGVAVPTMFVVGGIFVVLWAVALRLGGRIDRERRERLGLA